MKYIIFLFRAVVTPTYWWCFFLNYGRWAFRGGPPILGTRGGLVPGLPEVVSDSNFVGLGAGCVVFFFCLGLLFCGVYLGGGAAFFISIS